MTLYDDDITSPRVLRDLEQRRHAMPAQRTPWVDPEVTRQRALEDMAEEIRGLEDELANRRAEYARLAAWEMPDRAAPGVDARTFPSAGTEAQEAWR